MKSHKRYYVKAGFIWLATLYRSKAKKFFFSEKEYAYLTNWYNVTWLNERRVEVPVALNELSAFEPSSVLEIGNVLSHYDPRLRHVVVDKYENSNRPEYYQQDVEDFDNGRKYLLIISVSTLEHVGWDESPCDEAKVTRAINHLRGLLSHDGELFFTAPIGYNPALDRWIDEGDGIKELRCMRRVSALNEWCEVSWAEVRGMRFHSPYPFANGLVFVRVSARGS